MASASRVLFFARCHLFLLLLFFLHKSQSCLTSVCVDCNEYKGENSVDFSSVYAQQECGHCGLVCGENGRATINCTTNQKEHFQVLNVSQDSRTIVIGYSGSGTEIPKNYSCLAYALNVSFPRSPLLTFTILGEPDTLVRCPYTKGDKYWDNGNKSVFCGDEGDSIVYGPYKPGQLPSNTIPQNCSSIQVPSLSNNKFSLRYNISKQGSTGKKLTKILGSVIGGLVAFIIIALIVYWKRRKNKSGSSPSPSRMMSFYRTRSDLEGGGMNGLTVFSYSELKQATDNFHSTKELGEGGFGIVYHGKLKDGREVAVKRLFEKNYKRIEQFKNEIRILTDLRHQNLVTLYGCTTYHSRELLLVYEYIPNGTVADHLHGEQSNSTLLPWSTRMKIAIETATALSYLHFNDIIHRDVKTNNILLDNNFCVKVADFGLSRLFPADVTHVSTAPQGTPGYLDPEYHQCYHLTDKSDVYSFGVVLIELISSLLAVDVERHRHEINLSTYAMNRIQCCAFNELIDPKLGFETDFKVRRMTTLVAELAFQCLQHDMEIRPSMEEVLESLKRIASVDYAALETEEINTTTSKITKPPPSPTDNDDVGLLRNTQTQPRSPVSVMEKWLNSSKSTVSNSSTSSYKTTSS